MKSHGGRIYAKLFQVIYTDIVEMILSCTLFFAFFLEAAQFGYVTLVK